MSRFLNPALPFLAILALFAGFLWWGNQSAPRVYAERAIAECASTEDKGLCYEEIVPYLYPELGVAEVFEVVRDLRRLDASYQFCHVLAHKLGQRVVAEDAEKWMEAIALNPADGMCSNGFVHGVTGGRFRSEVLSDATIEQYLGDFAAACAPRPGWSPSDLDRAICYHGMGHLYDFITNANIPKALALCSRTAPEEYQRVCVEGVFMQIYQPLEPDDFELIAQMEIKPSTTTVRDYCAAFNDPAYVGACLRESWPYVKEGIKDGSAVGAFCAGHPDAQRTDECYQTVSALAGRLSLESLDTAAAACSRYPKERQGACFGYGAESIIQEDRNDSAKAIRLCRLADAEAKDGCLDHLLSHADFMFGENYAQKRAFCQALPVERQASCRAQLL